MKNQVSCNLLIVLSPLIGLAVNCLALIAGHRRFPQFGLLKWILISFSLGLLTSWGLMISGSSVTRLLDQKFIGQFLTNSITYFALGYCFFHFNNLGETARRIRIIRELLDSDSGLTAEQILECYNAEQIVRARLERMLTNKQVVIKNGKFFLARGSLLTMSHFIVFFKILLLSKRSEFER